MSPPLVMYFSSKALPLKDCVTCPKSVTTWGPSIQIEEPKGISYSNTIGIYHSFAWCTRVHAACVFRGCLVRVSSRTFWLSDMELRPSGLKESHLADRFSLFTISLDCELT